METAWVVVAELRHLAGAAKCRVPVHSPLDVPEQCCGVCLPTLTDRGSASCSNSSPPPPCPAFASACPKTCPASISITTAYRALALLVPPARIHPRWGPFGRTRLAQRIG